MTIQHILIVAPNWIGDTVMAGALVAHLRAHQPQAHITMMAPEWTAHVCRRFPGVDAVIVHPFQHKQLHLRARYRFAKTLRQRFDVAYVLPNSFKAALIPYWAHIPRRIGYLGEKRYGVLTHPISLDVTRYPRLVDRYTALYMPPIPTIRPVLQPNREAMQTLAARYDLNDARPLLLMAPGAAYGPAKRWPVAYFTEVAAYFMEKNWQICLLGSAADSADVAPLVASLPSVKDLTGKTSLSESIDIIALGQFMLTNDSGLMHIAAALDTPLAAIYGSSDPTYTPPLHPEARVLSLRLPCAPCFKRTCPLKHTRCLMDLTPDSVIRQITETTCVSSS